MTLRSLLGLPELASDNHEANEVPYDLRDLNKGFLFGCSYNHNSKRPEAQIASNIRSVNANIVR